MPQAQQIASSFKTSILELIQSISDELQRIQQINNIDLSQTISNMSLLRIGVGLISDENLLCRFILSTHEAWSGFTQTDLNVASQIMVQLVEEVSSDSATRLRTLMDLRDANGELCISHETRKSWIHKLKLAALSSLEYVFLRREWNSTTKSYTQNYLPEISLVNLQKTLTTRQ